MTRLINRIKLNSGQFKLPVNKKENGPRQNQEENGSTKAKRTDLSFVEKGAAEIHNRRTVSATQFSFNNYIINVPVITILCTRSKESNELLFRPSTSTSKAGKGKSRRRADRKPMSAAFLPEHCPTDQRDSCLEHGQIVCCVPGCPKEGKDIFYEDWEAHFETFHGEEKKYYECPNSGCHQTFIYLTSGLNKAKTLIGLN